MLGSKSLTSTRGATDKTCLWRHPSNGGPPVQGSPLVLGQVDRGSTSPGSPLFLRHRVHFLSIKLDKVCILLDGSR